jgi:diguanylate cyclase (GGDEF)-like protein
VLCLTGFPEDRPPTDAEVAAWRRLARPAGEACRIGRGWALARTRSGHDGLTGLPNRRAFERALRREVERARRMGGGLAVGLLDLDHFKRVNDEHGHPAGDRVLREVARRLGRVYRDSDMVARVGGEEFAVLLPSGKPPTEAEAFEALDRARRRVRARAVLVGGRPRTITLSGGVAILGPEGEGPAALYARADEALYAAKAAGRDRVEVAAAPRV